MSAPDGRDMVAMVMLGRLVAVSVGEIESVFISGTFVCWCPSFSSEKGKNIFIIPHILSTLA